MYNVKSNRSNKKSTYFHTSWLPEYRKYSFVTNEEVGILTKEIQEELENIFKCLDIKEDIQKFIKYSKAYIKSFCFINTSINFIYEEIWSRISAFQFLSENFMNCFWTHLKWEVISQYQKINEMSENFIEKHTNRLRWIDISQYQVLSENFIRKYQNKLSWGRIARYQKLSENFIREYKDIVQWNIIAKYQKLSIDFMFEFYDQCAEFKSIVNELIREKQNISNNMQYIEV